MKVTNCLINGTQSRHLVSQLFKPLNVIPHGHQAKKVQEISSKSHRLLIDNGVIRQGFPGSFVFLPLGLRALNKLEKLIDFYLQQIDCQKILLPFMTDGVLWKESGRWDVIKDELFKIKNRNDHDFVLGPTFEEAITHLVANLGNITAKSLPLKLYQISTKFRDEMRPKFGLIRSREFVMKDLYTFDADKLAARETYDQILKCYDAFFQGLQVPFVRVEGDTGSIGGTLSHEFHFISDIGQDNLIICQDCRHGTNLELVQDKEKCCKCSSRNLQERKGIEVGHTFLLGDKYSKCFNATFTGMNGKPQLFQMGCYGLGVSRILAASLEVLSNENELKWPKLFVPYQIAIIAPKEGSKEASQVMPQVYNLYDQLSSRALFTNEVIIDDRPKPTVGKKLSEAKSAGYSYIILFGKGCIDDQNPVIELHTCLPNETSEMINIPINQVLYHFETIKSHQI